MTKSRSQGHTKQECMYEKAQLKAGMWKWQIFVEAEAGSGKKVPLPLWSFTSNVKNLNVVQIFVKYTKSEC